MVDLNPCGLDWPGVRTNIGRFEVDDDDLIEICCQHAVNARCSCSDVAAKYTTTANRAELRAKRDTQDEGVRRVNGSFSSALSPHAHMTR